MAEECMLTTYDNPYDPFTQFDDWFMFDIRKGYNCCSILARIANVPEGLSSKEEDELIDYAIDEIIKYDFTNVYRKFYKGQVPFGLRQREETEAAN